jgi:GTP-dependent phosphoenolpyruvate carboxykinase
LNLPVENIAKVLSVDVDGWLQEIPLIEKHFGQFGTHLPDGLRAEVENLTRRLQAAKK